MVHDKHDEIQVHLVEVHNSLLCIYHYYHLVAVHRSFQFLFPKVHRYYEQTERRTPSLCFEVNEIESIGQSYYISLIVMKFNNKETFIL